MTDSEILKEILRLKEDLNTMYNKLLNIKVSVSCLADEADNSANDNALESIENIEQYLNNLVDTIGVRDGGIMGELSNLELMYI